MSSSAYQSSSITRLAKEATPRLGWLLLAAVVCAILGGVATAGLLQKAFLAAAAALAVFSITLVVVKLLCDRTAKSELNTLLGLVDKEATATIITDAEGAVLALNQSALGRFDASDTNKNSVSSVLENSLANPSAMKQYEGIKYSDDQHNAFFLAQVLILGILPKAILSKKKTGRYGI